MFNDFYITYIIIVSKYVLKKCDLNFLRNQSHSSPFDQRPGSYSAEHFSWSFHPLIARPPLHVHVKKIKTGETGAGERGD